MSQSPLNLEGKVAVVVGGTSGIGRALSLGLAEAGADVVASARRTEQVESVAAEIEAKGGRTVRVSSDVSDRASLQNLLDQTLAHLGKVLGSLRPLGTDAVRVIFGRTMEHELRKLYESGRMAKLPGKSRRAKRG